jgi:hypothetical protein
MVTFFQKTGKDTTMTDGRYDRLEKTDAFLLDVDGTCAINDGHRHIHDYSRVIYDKPNKSVITVAEAVSLKLQPVVMSGRPDQTQVRYDTLDWFYTYTKLDSFPLFMRPEFLKDNPDKRDYRKDYIVKEELYREKVEPYFNIWFAIDDRLGVCRMWHRLGIPLLRFGDPDADY